jgi:hypothetical protein
MVANILITHAMSFFNGGPEGIWSFILAVGAKLQGGLAEKRKLQLDPEFSIKNHK